MDNINGEPYEVEVVLPSDAATIASLVSLERQLFKKNDSMADDMEATVKKRNCLTMVARRREDGKVCGYVLCTCTGLNLHVSKIAVREDCRRQGIGRNLMLVRWVA